MQQQSLEQLFYYMDLMPLAITKVIRILDILILVDKDKITSPDAKRVTYPLYEIEFETGTIISPLVLSKKSWETKHRITPFYENVRKEGIIL